MLRSGSLLAALGYVLLSASAHADTLLYTFTTTASGDFNPTGAIVSTPFTNVPLTVSTTVQSADVQTALLASGASYTYVAGVPLTINVLGSACARTRVTSTTLP